MRENKPGQEAQSRPGAESLIMDANKVYEQITQLAAVAADKYFSTIVDGKKELQRDHVLRTIVRRSYIAGFLEAYVERISSVNEQLASSKAVEEHSQQRLAAQPSLGSQLQAPSPLAPKPR